MASQNTAAEFAKQIESPVSPTVTFDDDQFGKYYPDIVFKHAQAKYPGVVIEVSSPEKKKDLPRLANDYILGSRGRIGTVVDSTSMVQARWPPYLYGNPELKSKKMAKKHLLRTKWCQIRYSMTNGSATVFRNEDGSSIDDPQLGLRVRLQDFAEKGFADGGVSFDEEIFISAKELFMELCEAERETRESSSAENEGFDPEILPRCRESTPPEMLRKHAS